MVFVSGMKVWYRWTARPYGGRANNHASGINPDDSVDVIRHHNEISLTRDATPSGRAGPDAPHEAINSRIVKDTRTSIRA